MKITIELDTNNACRTNTGRAQLTNMHYDLEKLISISGARMPDIIANLQWCAEHQDDESALLSITNFASALLSAYDIQRESYKQHK